MNRTWVLIVAVGVVVVLILEELQRSVLPFYGDGEVQFDAGSYFGGGILSKVGDFVSAIFNFEGGNPGDMNVRNNNPGNLVFAGQPGASKGPGGFAVFSSMDAGTLATQKQLALNAKRHPDWTIYDNFVHWLGGDGPGGVVKDDGSVYVNGVLQGNAKNYAAYVAGQVGASINSTLKSLGF